MYLIYRNLNNGKWSIKEKASGLVVGYADNIVGVGVSFKVSESGRQRVIAEGCKNVHSYICVDAIYALTNFVAKDDRNAVVENVVTSGTPHQISYNPYKQSEFYYVDTQQAISHNTRFKCVHFDSDSKVYISEED